MLSKADNSATFVVAAALGLFFIGGLLTTVVPPLVDKSWGKPFENQRPGERSDRQAGGLHRRRNCTGGAIYVREGCWYCHTQQTRTLLADTIRSRLEGRALAGFDAG